MAASHQDVQEIPHQYLALQICCKCLYQLDTDLCNPVQVMAVVVSMPKVIEPITEAAERLQVRSTA